MSRKKSKFLKYFRQTTGNLWFVFFTALMIRLIAWFGSSAFNNFSVLHCFVPELRSIPTNILKGQGFTYNIFSQTLKVAHEPIYFLLVSFIFLLAGTTTYKAYLILALLNILLSSLTVLVLFYIGKIFFTERVGLIASWLYTFLALNIDYNHFIWYSPALLPFLHCLIILLLGLFYQEKKKLKYVLLLGPLIALTFLIKPVIIFFLAGYLLYLLISKPAFAKNIFLIVLVCCICLLPWSGRNFLTAKNASPVRETFYINLCYGNIDNPNDLPGGFIKYSPFADQQEYQLLRKFGEIKYYQYKKNIFLTWLQNNPILFVKLTLQRIYNYWWGEVFSPKYNISWFFITKFLLVRLLLIGWLTLIFTKKIALGWQNILFICLFMFLPLAYYITNINLLYNLELDPLLTVPGALYLTVLFKYFQKK